MVRFTFDTFCEVALANGVEGTLFSPWGSSHSVQERSRKPLLTFSAFFSRAFSNTICAHESLQVIKIVVKIFKTVPFHTFPFSFQSVIVLSWKHIWKMLALPAYSKNEKDSTGIFRRAYRTHCTLIQQRSYQIFNECFRTRIVHWEQRSLERLWNWTKWNLRPVYIECVLTLWVTYRPKV